MKSICVLNTWQDHLKKYVQPCFMKWFTFGTCRLVFRTHPGVANTTVNIATTITYQEGWTWEDVKPHAEKAVDDYFKELASTWANNEALIVRISQIEIRLLNVSGIVDIAATTINGLEQNLALGADNIPVRGSLNG